MTVDPRITAILEARKSIKVLTLAEVQAQTPPAAAEARLQALSLPTMPEMVEAPAPTPDSTVESWLTEHLDSLIAETLAVFKAERQGGVPEAFEDAMTLIVHVSQAVKTGLPLVKGGEAKAIVSAVVLWLFNTFAASRLGPVPSMMIRTVLPMLVQFAYDAFVSAKK
ncbi:hypothetical protein [Deinococcus peraridilitoris]|uniref:Uncharacterized protein n=1 Tax=Deinococcus peraridilitoris (strain DSM 19664 / LMG 22246 / CIP 109416 / KR-200) TaxID=937777 RepID=L0A132_DEIPD|nr:hypothetical protein [Deinococcus peraridilitoris]AFZ67588.1 hypothetical protein Deipe_2093 [Deinococcus peraridilitoris DSM 19664]